MRRRDRFVTPEAFSVAPELIGRKLAAPWRRLAAILVDLVAVGIVAQLGAALLLALGATACARIALRQVVAWRRYGGLAAAVVLAACAVTLLVTGHYGESGPAIHVGTVGSGREIVTVDTITPSQAPNVADVRAYADALASGDAVKSESLRPAIAEAVARPELRALREERDAAALRSKEVERQMEQSGESPLRRWVSGIANDLGIGLGWSALYFTVLTASWGGHTLGKRLCRIRVARLDGKPITWWGAFNRFGGYAASALTGLLGFAELLWDQNRQALHDKGVGTVVLADEPSRAGESPNRVESP